MQHEQTCALHEIRTPEGVTLPFEIGSAGDRLAAFVVDITLVIAFSTLISLLAYTYASPSDASRIAGAVALIVAFVLRNFYFTFAELRGNGTTIGKRRFGLRVVSRDGGPLTPSAVFARNLTREIETFIPLVAILQPGALLPGLPAWGALLGVVWVLIFALLPLFNRDRLRIGDILAGTIVVRMPRTQLLQDVAEMADIRAPRGVAPSEEYVFTAAQLDLYGVHELQVLERILRRDATQADHQLLEAVAENIKRKIDWPRGQWDVNTWSFLVGFYKAQRARLEQGLLFGQRRDRKRDAGER